jgi:hypothetical protein
MFSPPPSGKRRGITGAACKDRQGRGEEYLATLAGQGLTRCVAKLGYLGMPEA